MTNKRRAMASSKVFELITFGRKIIIVSLSVQMKIKMAHQLQMSGVCVSVVYVVVSFAFWKCVHRKLLLLKLRRDVYSIYTEFVNTNFREVNGRRRRFLLNFLKM